MKTDTIVRRRLRVPRTSGAMLLQPSLSAVPGLLAAAAQRTADNDCDLQGHRLTELAALARRELLDRARAYTADYRDVDATVDDPAQPIILGGHQPELFHPGVWLKNFVLSELARRHGAVAVNLIIDSDTVKGPAINVPGGSLSAPVAERVPLDRWQSELPYEERSIVDPDCFRSFGQRAAQVLEPLLSRPIITQLWPLAVAGLSDHTRLGTCLARARHQLEGQWGLATYELPLSQVCQLAAFHRLSAYLLAHLSRYWDVFNTALAEYRTAYRIRSRSHPVPKLAKVDDFLEAPFWIWTSERPERRPLFVRSAGPQQVLCDRQGLEIRLPIGGDAQADRACEELADLPRRGVKLRPRATLTTLFARLFLGDLFVHGIGGAAYDQLTDQVMRRFLGVEPPPYLIATATLHLPIPRPRVTTADRRQTRQQLRELTFHPEHHVPWQGLAEPEDRADVARLVAEKERWIALPKTRANARERHVGITQANQGLVAWLTASRQRLQTDDRRIEAALRREAILASREYAFCLYPEETLRDLFAGIPQ
jgi:hypothetical protein